MYQTYSTKVAGISCTNCTAKIKKTLIEELGSELKTISVSVLHEKVTMALQSESSLEAALAHLQKIGYPPVGIPALI